MGLDRYQLLTYDGSVELIDTKTRKKLTIPLTELTLEEAKTLIDSTGSLLRNIVVYWSKINDDIR